MSKNEESRRRLREASFKITEKRKGRVARLLRTCREVARLRIEVAMGRRGDGHAPPSEGL